MDFAVFKVIMVIMTTGSYAGGVDTLPFANMAQCQANVPIVEQAVISRTGIFAGTTVFCIELTEK
jgi:hypothetical protein